MCLPSFFFFFFNILLFPFLLSLPFMLSFCPHLKCVCVFAFSLPPWLVSSFFNGWLIQEIMFSSNTQSSSTQRLWLRVWMSSYSKWLKSSRDQQSTVFLIWEVNFFLPVCIAENFYHLTEKHPWFCTWMLLIKFILMECFENIKFPKVMTHAIKVSLTKSFIKFCPRQKVRCATCIHAGIQWRPQDVWGVGAKKKIQMVPAACGRAPERRKSLHIYT